jgi:hypothetical protein
MTESEARTTTTISSREPKSEADHQADLQSEARRKQALDKLMVRVPKKPMPKKRAKQREPLTERQKAIVEIPRTESLEEYCRELDRKKSPLPGRWQKNGKPRTNLEAWEQKGSLRDRLKSERNNAWRRFLAV